MDGEIKLVGSIESIDYYAHSRLLASGSLNGTGLLNPFNFFGPDVASGTGTGCDLSFGVLPDNATGRLRFIGFQFWQSSVAAVDVTANVRCLSVLPQLVSFECYVMGVRAMRGPCSMFGAPASVLQGISDVLNSANNSPFVSGPMSGAAQLDHPIGAGQVLRVGVASRQAVPANLRPTVASELTLGMTCILGVGQSRALLATP